jgi:hypothetical protein
MRRLSYIGSDLSRCALTYELRETDRLQKADFLLARRARRSRFA